MMTKSPSGALSPYYYKGGYFHGIHYGSYFDNSEALLSMMKQEELFLLKSCEKRRILIDLYETNLSEHLIKNMVQHIINIRSRIVKLAITSNKKSLRQIKKAISKETSLGVQQIYFCTDMEEGKTWLVSERN